jgi:hypothetical protein
MVFIPTPPLRYWPAPPPNEGIFEMDLSITPEDDMPSLERRYTELRQLQHRVTAHYGQVIEWTERCHAESELHPVSIEKEWLAFVLEIKQYLTRHVAKRNDNIEQAIAKVNMQQLAIMRRGLLARLERLEQEHDKIEAKRLKLTEAVSSSHVERSTDLDLQSNNSR